MDFADVTLPGVKAIRVNLADRASIDAAVDECGGVVHALFSCAGVADGTPGIERINFVGHRHLIDRMVSKEMLRRGSAICLVSSLGGVGWEQSLPRLSKLLDIPDFDAAARWFVKRGQANYTTTKLAIGAYVARQAFPLLKRGIRINAISPGATDTPLAQANKETWLGFGTDYREAVGIQPFTPLEQAYPISFSCAATRRRRSPERSCTPTPAGSARRSRSRSPVERFSRRSCSAGLCGRGSCATWPPE
jgi:NAD(P)-dependent dehydrogenase (short-subunit alcohol dehydrogenase family)